MKKQSTLILAIVAFNVATIAYADNANTGIIVNNSEKHLPITITYKACPAISYAQCYNTQPSQTQTINSSANFSIPVEDGAVAMIISATETDNKGNKIQTTYYSTDMYGNGSDNCIASNEWLTVLNEYGTSRIGCTLAASGK
ncbi:MAG: hypothetical protein EPO11_01870 [Gammaproteobacteria bacterium]|nr:MAG: hypothetical protein EPO11_01870 [Gammaproteobacteria bacterium]